jgi:hypothetical protein
VLPLLKRPGIKLLNGRLRQAGIKSKTDELYIGMTPKALIDAMKKGHEDGKCGRFMGGALSTVAGNNATKGSEGFGVALPGQETTWRGVRLDKKGLSALTSRG